MKTYKQMIKKAKKKKSKAKGRPMFKDCEDFIYLKPEFREFLESTDGKGFQDYLEEGYKEYFEEGYKNKDSDSEGVRWNEMVMAFKEWKSRK